MTMARAVLQSLPRLLQSWIMPHYCNHGQGASVRYSAANNLRSIHVDRTLAHVMPSFVSGVADLQDLRDDLRTYYRLDKRHADWRALRGDFHAIALDFQLATERVLEQKRVLEQHNPYLDSEELRKELRDKLRMQLPAITNYGPKAQKAVQKAP